MHRFDPSLFACVLLLAGASACAGSHKHAEVPDFTEKGWSEPAPEFVKAKADPTIQSAVVSTGDTSATAPPADTALPPATTTASPATAAADSSAPALPPAPKATKPGSKKKKKSAKPKG